MEEIIPELDLQDLALLHASLEEFSSPGKNWRIIGRTMIRLEAKIQILKATQEEKKE